MEKKWLLRLPKDLDDWLTLKAAEETVSRGKRVSKNTLIIELATKARDGELPEHQVKSADGERWQSAKEALAFIQKTIEVKAEEGVGVSDCVFRSKPATHSIASRPPIPE